MVGGMGRNDQDPNQEINSLLNGRGKWVVLGIFALLAVVFIAKAVTG